MKSITKTYLFISIFLIAVVAGIFIYLNSLTDWDETYKMNSDQPYGLDVISKLLESSIQPGKFHTIKALGDSSIQHYTTDAKMNYVFIGDYYYADTVNINQLLKFVERGNNAFISSKYFPYEIQDLFVPEVAMDTSDEEPEENYIEFFPVKRDSVAHLNFTGGLTSNDDLVLRYNNHGLKSQYNWQYIEREVFLNDMKNIFVIGTINENINFVKIEHGSGNIFIHSTPIAFTNYFIVADQGREYSERAFSVLNEGDIIWDEYNKLPKYNYRLAGETSTSGPLMFILSRESLRWAWYLLLFFLLIYAIFIGKRRQRIIPVIEKNNNTSLEYARTVGKLYFLERDHRTVCLHKMKHFQAFLRNRYFILTTQWNEEMIDRLSMVSCVNRELVSDIFNQFALMNTATELSDQELIKFHQSLTRFYKECI
jgi:hypothetical protein